MEVASSPISSRSAASNARRFAGELTYVLERLAMYVQGVDNVYDLNFNGREGTEKVTLWRCFPCRQKQDYSRYNFEVAPTPLLLLKHFEDAEKECEAIPQFRCPHEPGAAAQMRASRPMTSASRRPTCSTCSIARGVDFGTGAPGLYSQGAQSVAPVRRGVF